LPRDLRNFNTSFTEPLKAIDIAMYAECNRIWRPLISANYATEALLTQVHGFGKA